MKKLKILSLLCVFFLAGGTLGYWKGSFLITSIHHFFNKKEETIFISIASYRDKNCPRTIEEIYNNADHPERIFVGIYQQNDTYDLSCQTSKIDPKLQKNISLVTVSAIEAKGPAIARYHAAKLYKEEDFFMEIDSHMRLLPHWDTTLLNMWHKLAEEKGPKVILTAYPMEWDVENDKLDENYKTQVPLFCGMKFPIESIPQPYSAIYDKTGKFHESPFIAAGFLFGPGKMLQDVPYDPNLHYLFHGEELLLSARLWCKGYRLYNPIENIIFHYYERTTEPKVWDDPNYYTQNTKITEKAKILLGMVPGQVDTKYPYGITPQCLKEYYKTYKIDLIKKTSINLCEPGDVLINIEPQKTENG